ncbi:carboxypeptidase-like regulatory domain-containing protein [Haliangium ochraceum]|uniref:PDZ/DHR/GLGF domain protein n=1 Tax=Haliangium ochraceum (strain DSM 14365 / JCM 11303 / SMP-2) TaxID=502025 RepID=D0LTW9_HALO1|nr:carboxypeptidase-like regulatory domain-containing protein [Haliangium ochraceum]ACY15813.1 PDZ/DHR/GLGF domain protein [Haliangium ochraceum DSM 14365]
MAKQRTRELVLASIAFLAVGVLGYWLLETRPSPPERPLLYVADDGGIDTARGAAGTERTRARPSVDVDPERARVSGEVRELLSGEGVAGVSVVFVPADENQELSTESDERGRYAIELPAGRYRVRAVGEQVVALDGAAFPGAGEPSAVAEGAGQGQGQGQGQGLELERAALLVQGGSAVDDFDIAVLRLAQVSGRVVDGQGEPVAGALVRHHTELLDRRFTSASTAPEGEAGSDRAGAFTLRVPPGAVSLHASAEGHTPSYTRIRWVAPGAELSGVEIVMDAGASVTGLVVGPDDAAVAGAAITAQPGSALADALRTTSDADGGFRFTAVPPGQVRIEASAPGRGSSMPATVTVSDTPGLRGERVVLVLSAPVVAAGRVLDAEGRGVSGARVRALAAQRPEPIAEELSDSNGRFRFRALPRGPLSFAAAATGFASGQVSEVALPAEHIEIPLARSGAVRGVVRGDGGPLGHFYVHALRRATLARGPGVQPAPAGEDAFWERGVRIVSPDGGYRITGLPPGTYTVRASAPGLAPAEETGIIVGPGNEASVDFALAGGGAIVGSVRNEATDAPISGAAVTVSTGSGGQMSYTDARGSFRIRDIAPGRRSLEVVRPGFIGRVRSGITVGVGEPARVDLALTPAALDGGDGPFEIAGIGAVLAIEGERLMVRELMPHAPAEVAGVEPGEEVFLIDTLRTRGISFETAIEAIRGVAGTSVRLGLRRGERERFLEIVRAAVRVKPAPG